MPRKKYFSMLIFLVSLIFCSPHPLKTTPQTPLEKLKLNIPENATDKIVFLTFKISLEDSTTDKHLVTLINSTLAEGKLKIKSFKEPVEIEKNYLYFELSADENGVKNYERVENPLRMVYEYPGEVNGQLAKALIKNKTGDFVIRFQYDSSMKYLLIYKPGIDSLILKPIYRGEIVH